MKSWDDVNPHQFDSLHNYCKQNIFFAFHEALHKGKIPAAQLLLVVKLF